ncbi:DUF1992 domain-containing protein [Glutamicibacter sp. PS]|uniref:DnaJ family domain-containing protein n=1 Tax=Glutamicibacter sp. PS TaxID=3075634 RepID=UPI002845587A|nr:DUF1992 domain-containing protein [Glutamicibacter sp. PS]MDR4531983.1 DUF1992 domain-containing protein [Glutamicibacter sp. PS]
MSPDPHREAKDAALHAARYRAERATEEPLPVDEYAQRTGAKPVERQPRTPLQFHAHEEAWEVANSAIDEAFARGDFDNLSLAGKNIDHIAGSTDPDWWVKSLMQREQISGLGPPALTLRVEDAELLETLDALSSAGKVREHLEDFNRRIIEARRQLQGGPPVITTLRDVDQELEAWEERRRDRAAAKQAEQQPSELPKRRWFGRGRNKPQA